jgi:hypothetical protein
MRDSAGNLVLALGSTNGLYVNLATGASGSSLMGSGWQDGVYWRQARRAGAGHSNWEKTLGTDAAEQTFRQDVFLVQLTPRPKPRPRRAP